MPWDAAAQLIAEFARSLLISINGDVIESAESNPDSEFELTNEQESEIAEIVDEFESALNQAVIDDLPAEIEEDFEFDSGVLFGSAAITTFFLRKQIADGIRRIHAATIARQILASDREAAQETALQRSLDTITNAAAAESSSAFSLKHQQAAIESGFTYFRYNTSEDDVVRPEHNRRNNMVFRYGAERTVDDVPGLANNCRCFAEPLTLEEALQGTFFYTEDRPENQAMVIKNKGKFDIRCEANQVSIDVIGVIDMWDGNDFEAFSQKVNSFIEPDTEELVINVTSYGGDADESFLAFDLLSSLDVRVVVNVFGYAASAATHFVMAADHATIGENDNFMIHQAWTCPCGNKEELQSTIETLAEYDERQIAIYMSKTGRTREEIEDLLGEERIINSEEALEFGFIDEIRPDSNRSRAARGEPTAQANFSSIRTDGRKPTSKDEGQPMKLEDILAFLNKDATDDDKSQILSELGGVSKDDSEKAVSEVQAKLDSANTDIAVKDSIIKAAASGSGESDSEEIRENIRAEIRAEIEAESKAKLEISAQVEKAGLKVDGETSSEILANAIEQAGGVAAEESGKQFPDEVLNQIWASIAKFRGASDNSADIHSLQSGSHSIGKKPKLSGSRAQRINKNK